MAHQTPEPLNPSHEAKHFAVGKRCTLQTTDGSFGLRSNQFGFNITGTANTPIVVEARTDFGNAWVPLQSVSLTNGSFYFSDPQWTNYTNRFYRIRSP